MVNQDRAPLVDVSCVSKSFGSNRVLKDVDLAARPGEIHALLGPNGAGKSTLIKILSGYYREDTGTISVRSWRDATRPGRVGVAHQDFGLIDILSVRENFHLARNGGITRLGVIALRRERRGALEALRAVHVDVDPETQLTELGLGLKSLLVVARLLADDADVLLLDEVTAALTRSESDRVLTEMRRIADSGRAVVMVSHRLHEVVEHCDSVTVLRDGAVAYSGATPEMGRLHELLESGGEHDYAHRPHKGSSERPVLLDLSNVASDAIGPIDLQVRGGEVVAVIGSLSSGLYDIGHLAAGRMPVRSGRRTVASRHGMKPRCAIVPEDRRAQGILPFLEVAANLTVSAQNRAGRHGFLKTGIERSLVRHSMQMLSVQPPDPSMKIESLSGGNQQKVLMGRSGLVDPDLLVLCEPTRGVDIRTRRAIYEYVDSVRGSGAAVLVVTIDVDDALAVGDRIAVVENGRISDVLNRAQADTVNLLERVS
jgi:ribose transport system ATP-binding protein